MAVLGGVVLTALILITCISVAGRSLTGVGLGPITGDVELTEAGMAFAIFAFLPYCHMMGGHASVDVFTARLPSAMNRWLAALWASLFAAVLILIAVQLYSGTLSKVRSGQTSFLIEFPIWWAYAASLLGAALAAVVATYLAAVRLAEALAGRDIIPQSEDPA